MDISLFWEFLVLYEVRNYSVAAHQLSLSESSLSRHIKTLESELGVLLFDRTPRKVVPTEYGEALVKYAQQIMDVRRRYTAELRQIDKKRHNTFIIYSTYNIGAMLEAFRERYPAINVEWVRDTGSPDEIISRLRDGECEVAYLAYLPNDCDGLVVELFESDCYAAVLPLGHPLAERREIELADLAYEDFIMFSNSDFINQKMIENCRQAGFTPNTLSLADDARSISSLIKHNGVTLLLKKIAERDNFPGVCLIDIVPALPVQVYLCYLASANLPPDVRQLVDFSLGEWRAIDRGAQ